MNCIIVDDEPVARKGMKSLVEQIPQLVLIGSFNNAIAASVFMNEHHFSSFSSGDENALQSERNMKMRSTDTLFYDSG